MNFLKVSEPKPKQYNLSEGNENGNKKHSADPS